MDTKTPKQFLVIHNVPVLFHTIGAFINADPHIRVIVVLSEKDQPLWNDMLRKYSFSHPVVIKTGGATRFHSVKNGLEAIDQDGLVAIHDGVRPLVSSRLIRNCYQVAAEKGNAIPAIPIPESLREIRQFDNRAVDRNRYILIQTPQVFQTQQIKNAYDQTYREIFTDEATIVESFGYPVHLVEGDPLNLKLTTVSDLAIFKALLSKKPNQAI
jgi:2-C-methyl-D-erythritol 4-phosphate cytidylyltransferase